MTRQEAITEVCQIVALAYGSINNFSTASDCFCEEGAEARIEKAEGPCVVDGVRRRMTTYRNEGVTIVYVRQAVMEKLKKDGYTICEGFDQETGVAL